MSFKHTHVRTWQSPTGKAVVNAVELEDESEVNIDIASLANGATDVEIPVAFDSSRVKAVYILSTKDITIESNDGSSPDDTLTPKANKAISWVTGDPGTPPFSADVTKLFLSNASGAAAAVKIRILHDATP